MPLPAVTSGKILLLRRSLESSMTHLVQQAFGSDDVNLYEDVLKVRRDCNLAQLRKAYYKQALLFHPDKNESDSAKLKFQAISWAYQFLKDPDNRAAYDKDGILPGEDEEADEEGNRHWKEYFDTIFGKVSTSKIDEFSMKYKMSEDEEKDVLANYEKFRGNLTKMLEYVMLSEERDLSRWMEDYIKPAISAGKVKDYSETSHKALNRLSCKRNQQKQKQQTEDPDRTETDGSDTDEGRKRIQPKIAKKKKKATPNATTAKRKRQSDDENEDLIAAIRSRQMAGNPFAALGARYGVSMDVADPLDDDTFARLQTKYKKKK